MSTQQTETVRSYEEIPYVELPPDYQLHLASLLSQAYQQHGPIFRAHYFNNEIVFLVGPEANRFILINNRQKFSHHIGWGSIFQVEQLLGRGLLMMDGDEHAKHRKMMNPAFTVNYMGQYLPLMNNVIHKRAQEWAEADEVDIFDEARKITFDIAAETLTGLKIGPEVDQFRDLFIRLLFTPDFASPEEFQKQIAKLHAELHTLLRPKIEERRLKPTNDIFGMLVQARDENGQPMSDEQLIAHINILLVAGHETSTSLSTWLIYLLTQNQDYTKRILQEQAEILGDRTEPTLEDLKRMKVLENALSEAERLYPPVANGPRGAVEDFVFSGYHVPAGSHVFYSIVASHMIPDIFADPTRFDPDRFAPPREEHKKHPYALVGFGGGPRICIGINFAQIEMKAMISHILRNYELELVPDQLISQAYAVTGGPINGIRMRIKTKSTPFSS